MSKQGHGQPRSYKVTTTEAKGTNIGVKVILMEVQDKGSELSYRIGHIQHSVVKF